MFLVSVLPLSSVALQGTPGLSPPRPQAMLKSAAPVFITGPRLKEKYKSYVDPTTEAGAQEAKPNRSTFQVLDQM